MCILQKSINVSFVCIAQFIASVQFRVIYNKTMTSSDINDHKGQVQTNKQTLSENNYHEKSQIL